MALAKDVRGTGLDLTFGVAAVADAAEIVELRNGAAERLTLEFGAGHWSSLCTAAGVAQGIGSSRVLVARDGARIVATLRLLTKKPWAIDKSYFSPSSTPIYLVDMAVHATHQRRGIGRRLIEEAKRVVADWPGDAIRLDAYDATAGAGAFYSRCGFREVGRATYRATQLVYFEFLLERAAS
jgi:GNAT superfamily N-acetyltransferase